MPIIDTGRGGSVVETRIEVDIAGKGIEAVAVIGTVIDPVDTEQVMVGVIVVMEGEVGLPMKGVLVVDVRMTIGGTRDRGGID